MFGRWDALVGPEIAAHCPPQTLTEGELLVVAESTAWATQLRLMAPSILGKLHAQVGGDVVTRLRVVGPTAPELEEGSALGAWPGPPGHLRLRPAPARDGRRTSEESDAMSTPADRPGAGEPDDGWSDPGRWREPAHLGGGRRPGRRRRSRSRRVRACPPSRVPGGASPVAGAGGPRGDVAEVFAPQGDLVGSQGWALQHGWSISDGTGPQDAVLAELVASAPVRPGREHRPAGVLRGRVGNLEMVAFDVVYPVGRSWVAQWAVTAAPLLAAVPGFRLSPARFWKHRTAGLVPLASGNEAFDARWLLLAAEDAPELRRLVQDPGAGAAARQ